MPAQVSLHGRKMAIALPTHHLVSNDVQVTSPCVDASVTVGAENGPGSNQRAVTIQLKDSDGKDISYAEEVEVGVFLTNDRLAYVVTGGSTGITIGTDGSLLALVAKKRFVATSETDGDIDLVWEDSGTEAAYIGVRLPSGRWVMGDAALTMTS